MGNQTEHIRFIKRILVRIGMVALGAVVIVVASLGTYAFGNSFHYSAPYRFVGIFLLMILLSNILAKITRIFIEA